RGRARRCVSRFRLRVAAAGLFDVPGDEPRQAGRPSGVRLVEQSKLQGPSGQPVGPHVAHEPGHGGGSGDRRGRERRTLDARRRGAMSTLVKIPRVSGRPIPLRGNDIDTDRIIPARYLKAVTFDGLGQAAFFDERFDAHGSSNGHIMDDPRFRAKGSRVAIVNKNFGCGSSREHAPQSLLRWGIKALVGESFADIFFGNCVALGMPCVTASEADIAALMQAVEADPAHDLTVDLETLSAVYRNTTYAIQLPPGVRNQFLQGTWDVTRVLPASAERIAQTAARLPYVRGFGNLGAFSY